MTTLSIVLSSIIYAPVTILAAPVLAAMWLAKPGEQRIQLPNEQWQLSRVVLAQASPIG
ncbi:MAG: hypothetical protein QNJ98_19180 [Planctomycetota bacterium]|nr:hypothetical protein [Planctomycetota bacterium]